MNWYFEVDGVSHGPHPEAELEARVRSGAISASQLIWQVGMENWSSVQALRPDWLKASTAKPPAPAPEEAPAPDDAEPASGKPRRERVVSTAKPAPSRLKPAPAKAEKAEQPEPADQAEPAGKPEKPEKAPPAKAGLLKRLFGKK